MKLFSNLVLAILIFAASSPSIAGDDALQWQNELQAAKARSRSFEREKLRAEGKDSRVERDRQRVLEARAAQDFWMERQRAKFVKTINRQPDVDNDLVEARAERQEQEYQKKLEQRRGRYVLLKQKYQRLIQDQARIDPFEEEGLADLTSHFRDENPKRK